MLEVTDLCKTYEGSTRPVLRGFRLQVGTGEFVSLIGPSGCGKTTALRIVAGLLAPTSGTVLVDGEPSLAPSPEKAVVFQMFNLFPWRTAVANAAYGLELQGVDKRSRTQIALYYLELLGLGKQANSYPSQLSGGQCQRVGIARALAIRPKLLLMDEPFGSLDALTREHLQGMLQDICATSDLTVLFVTHSLDEAIFLSDRIVIMGADGRATAERTVELAKPRGAYDWRATAEYGSLRASSWEVLQREMSAVAGS